MENYEQLPSSEKKSKEEGRLTEMARAQKEDIIKKDRIILMNFELNYFNKLFHYQNT